jgi:ribosomal protein S18 acetylase RimI-like enzyme
MQSSEIEVLKISNVERADEIHAIYQAAYRIEANLIGVQTFPPLERTPSDIRSSANSFYEAKQDDSCVGIIELEKCGDSKETMIISSLAVSPNYARRGIGKLLVESALVRATEFVVTTAEENLPAISLYLQLGFIQTKQFGTKEGIQMVEMRT